MIPVRVNPLQRLNAIIHAEKAEFYKGLLCVHCSINDKAVMAFMDSGATDNFIQIKIAMRIGLDLSPTNSMLKTVNSKVTDSCGVVKEGQGHRWIGSVDFAGVNLDDFEVIPGADFIKKAKVSVMPHLYRTLNGMSNSVIL